MKSPLVEIASISRLAHCHLAVTRVFSQSRFVFTFDFRSTLRNYDGRLNNLNNTIKKNN